MGTHGEFFARHSQKMLFLVVLSIFSLDLLVHADIEQGNSPHWVDVCGGSYLFSEELKTWNDASDMCLLFGSHLLQIDNMAENYCLLEYVQSQGIQSSDEIQVWWHSGNDIEYEGVYRQADGELILWIGPLWAGPDDPNQGTKANCLGVHLLGDDRAGKWYDEPCTAPHPYICERS